MAIEFQCVHCRRALRLKDKCAGLKGQCPYCNAIITVPTPVASIAKTDEPAAELPKSLPAGEADYKPPTQKQLDYAHSLGIVIPDGISRKALSRLIDDAQDNAPLSIGQKEFLHELGVSFPENIRMDQASMLIDCALKIRDDVSTAIHKRLEEQWKEAGMLTEHATVEQLLHEVTNRSKPFVVFVFEDDEFHYKEDRPMRGQLLWNNYLCQDDVMYLIQSTAQDWCKYFDKAKYSSDYDGKPAKVEFTAGEIPTNADNVVQLNISQFFVGPEN